MILDKPRPVPCHSCGHPVNLDHYETRILRINRQCALIRYLCIDCLANEAARVSQQEQER